MNKERITLNDELSIDIDKISDDEYTLIFIFYEMGEHGVKVSRKKMLEFKEALNRL
jgi:hypothetical protein